MVTCITLIHIFSVKNQQSHREQKQEADQAGMSGEELKVGHADEDCIQPKHCSLCVLNKDKACSFFVFKVLAFGLLVCSSNSTLLSTI